MSTRSQRLLVDLSQLLCVDGERIGATAAVVMAGSEAVEERSCLFEAESELDKSAYLCEQPQVAVVVLAVAVGRPARGQQTESS